MEFELYQEVALVKNLADTKFKKGDLATIIQIESSDEKIILTLEFFNILGESIGVYPVKSELVQHLKPNGIANMREM